MREMRVLCWNVNGIRSACRKGFLDWLHKESPDILCVQETKAHTDQLEADLLRPQGYNVYWSSPETKGYAGVATLSRAEPLRVTYGFGVQKFDAEARVIFTASVVHGRNSAAMCPRRFST